MSKILDLYEANKKALGIDKISAAAGKAANTPYSTDDLQKADEQVLTAAKFKTGRGGEISSSPKYSDIPRK